ncbi:MAG TPA: hypothetical protein VN915_05070 [Elusimicrobiota bacterium]|nr:hypothetical protein [Elusimicrobiota bacterium]
MRYYLILEFAVAFLLCAPSSQGAVILLNVGPVALHGTFAPMAGPHKRLHIRFNHPGWLRGYSVHILDDKGKVADDRDIFCHATIREGEPANMPGNGIYFDKLHLILEQGRTEMHFPDGYGVRVDSTTDYSLEARLQSRDAANDGIYSFQVRLEVAYEDDGAPPKDLQVLYIPINGEDEDWTMPPGENELRHEFTMPYSGTIHLAEFHIHEYVKKLSLFDAASKRTLYESPVANDAKGYPLSIPTYESAEGIPVAAGKRYEFVLAYSNPTNRSYHSMGIMRLFVNR